MAFAFEPFHSVRLEHEKEEVELLPWSAVFTVGPPELFALTTVWMEVSAPVG